MQQLKLTFKKHGEVIKRNLQADDGLNEKQLRRYANDTTAERWPELRGTLQQMQVVQK